MSWGRQVERAPRGCGCGSCLGCLFWALLAVVVAYSAFVLAVSDGLLKVTPGR